MSETEKSKRSTLRKIVTIVFLVAVAGLSALSAYFYFKYTEAKEMLENPQVAAQKEIDALKREISESMILPQEEPSVATITDKSALAEDEFLSKAENGDKILLFAEARRVILYRPTTKQIVDVGSFVTESIPNEAGTTPMIPEETVAPEPTPVVERPAPAATTQPEPAPEILEAPAE